MGAVSTPTANVAQHVEHCNDGSKMDLLVALLSEEASAEERGGPPMPLTIVFVERKSKCDDVAAALCAEQIPAAALHGGLGQVRAGIGGGQRAGPRAMRLCDGGATQVVPQAGGMGVVGRATGPLRRCAADANGL